MIRKFFRWLRWLLGGKPFFTYPGHCCGCCGTWTDEEYTVPTYKSGGEWWDTWGLCPRCAGEMLTPPAPDAAGSGIERDWNTEEENEAWKDL